MDEKIEENLKKISTWKRIFFMLIFAAIGGLVRMILWAVILLQIASVLLTGKPNDNVLKFGQSLSLYTYHILAFMTFNSETLPYPFAEWEMTEALQVAGLKQRTKK
jgi:hypothetical protein